MEIKIGLTPEENPYAKIQRTWRYEKDSDPEYPSFWVNPETGERLYASVVQEQKEIFDDGAHAGSLETLKSVVEWGNETCPHTPYASVILGEWLRPYRRECKTCWQALQSVAEGKG